MKKLYKTRSVFNENGQLVVDQIKLTDAVVNHSLNKHLKLSVGWHKLADTDCTTERPEVPPGEFGYYSCISGQWVFFPV